MNTSVQKIETNNAVQQPPEPAPENSVLAIIERAARDPNVDIDKMERLLQMQENVTARFAKGAFATALAQMQPELPEITQNGEILVNNEVRSRYATWEDINTAIKPVLAAHGFALYFRTGRENDQITVTAILSHQGGHSEETTMALPRDTSGSKNNVQSIGSSTSYGKRYTASALLNLTSRGEDDDGQAGGTATVSPEQLNNIDYKIEQTGADLARFCEYMGVDKIENIPAKQYDKAIAALNAKAKKNA